MDNLVKYEIPIYGGEFWIGFADNFVKFGQDLGIELRLSANDCNGITLKKNDQNTGIYIVLIKNDKVRPDIISHEAASCM